MLPINTNLERVNLLMMWLPKAGEGYLDKFIACLRSSSDECPVHNEIADEIEAALGRRGKMLAKLASLVVIARYVFSVPAVKGNKNGGEQVN